MGKIAHYEFPVEQTPCRLINSRNMCPRQERNKVRQEIMKGDKADYGMTKRQTQQEK